MPRKVALLDVDHTLLFHNTLNTQLIENLKKSGIEEVYLFTDMNYGKGGVVERKQLVKALESSGLYVHGVMTPQDLVDEIPKNECDILFNEYKGKFFGEEFNAFISKNKDRLPVSAAYLNLETYTQNRSGEPGRCFESQKSREYSQEQFMEMGIRKALADNLAQKFGFSHVKSLLFDYFSRSNASKPESERFTDITIVDDDSEKKIFPDLQRYKPLAGHKEGSYRLHLIKIPNETSMELLDSRDITKQAPIPPTRTDLPAEEKSPQDTSTMADNSRRTSHEYKLRIGEHRKSTELPSPPSPSPS